MSNFRPQTFADMQKATKLSELNTDKGAYMPTPEEIRERCLAIQEQWSEHEQESRKVMGSIPVDMMVCKLDRNAVRKVY